MKTPKQAVIEKMTPRFLQLGFKKRREGIYTKELADGFIGWIGMNSGGLSPGVAINPVMGIRWQALERLCSELLNLKPHPYTGPTISISLGYIMPEKTYIDWRFTGNPIDGPFDELADAVATYAVPLMEQNCTAQKMSVLLETNPFFALDQDLKRRQVAKYMLGQPAEGLRICEERLKNLGLRQDMAAEQYRTFAANFSALINSGA